MAAIHEAAATGFGRSAEAYERGRPDYPVQAVELLVDRLGLATGRTVLDLGAGTGKLTRALARTGARIIAVEPVASMRASLAANLPDVELREGTAERLPLATGSVDAVAVAQAFHWFDAPAALDEIHRVLRPGGGLGLMWNALDEREAWVAELLRLLRPYEGETPSYRGGTWQELFTDSALFSPLEPHHFRHAQRGSNDLMRARVASISFVAALPDAAQQTLLEAVEHLLQTHPSTANVSSFPVPYRTDVFLSQRS